MYFFIWLFLAFVFGFFTQALATAKGHDAKKFYWYGFWFGVIGLLFVIGLPTIAAPRVKAEAIRKSAANRQLPCPRCGRGLQESTIKLGWNICPHCTDAFEAESKGGTIMHVTLSKPRHAVPETVRLKR